MYSEFLSIINEAIVFEKITEEMPTLTTTFSGSNVPHNSLGWMTARAGRTGPVKSIKFQNITREVSRTVYTTVLLGIFPAAAVAASPVVGPIALVAGLAYAAYNAVSATVGYSDACVLHKAWKLARAANSNIVTLQDLLNVKDEMVEEYQAPKLKSDLEIEDAVNNLVGFKAMVRSNGELLLKESITFFEDGTIKS